MKKGTMIPYKKILGVGLLLIAVFYTISACSAYVGETILMIGGRVYDPLGWLQYLIVISVCGFSAYFLIKSGAQR